jgi:hypothetical protein
MGNLDTHEPGIQKFIDRGVYLPLPKPDKDGRYVMIIRPGQILLDDPLMCYENEARAGIALTEMLNEKHEKAIVNGVHAILDLTGCSPKMLTRMSPEASRNQTKMYQDCQRGRVKGIHIYNGGTIFELMMAIMKPLMKKKITERFQSHETLESLYKIFPVDMWPDEYLPDDYKGPSAGSIKDIIDNLKGRMLDPSFRARLLDYSSDKYKMDESRKPVSAPQESFRKLNID